MQPCVLARDTFELEDAYISECNKILYKVILIRTRAKCKMGGEILGNEKEKTGTAGGRPGGGGVKEIGAFAIQPLL